MSWVRRPAPPGERAALLEVRGLTKCFGPLTVLRGVSLQVRPGEIVAVAGGNGAGKSTLIGTIAGVLDADGGEVLFAGRPMPGRPASVRRAGVETVWQEHGLCDDLDAVANIFLGRPGRWVLSESAMREEAAAVLHRAGAAGLHLDVPLRVLSRGQRQLVALARALLTPPRLLMLDEPTASLGVPETARVESILRETREAGASVLLASHDLEQVFALADRIVVLRDGAVVADVTPVEVQRSDVVALMSGVEVDSIASRQIRRLQSLADQLSEAEPAASLPLIVSAMAGALDQDMLCVHLLETSGDQPVLRRLAATGLPSELLAVNAALPVGADGGPAGLAAADGAVVVVDDLLTSPAWQAGTVAAAASGVRSAWAAPIVGSGGVLGTVSGYAASPGNPAPERLELATIYLRYAASAIERERLLTEVSRRNRVLESLRGLLETLAGPERLNGGLEIALLALLDGLGADAAAVIAGDGGAGEFRSVAHRSLGAGSPEVRAHLRAAAGAVLAGEDMVPAGLAGPGLAAVSLRLPGQRGALAARWDPGTAITADALELLDDASRSLALAIERQALEAARQEAAALRRSQSIQRDMLSSLSHELRTPLTAIHGYASTLCQPDLTWNPESNPALPRVHRRRVGPDGTAGRGPAGLHRDRVRRAPAAARLVRPAPGGRGRRALPVRQAPARAAHPGGAGSGAGLGRPRPAGAGLREPAGERREPWRVRPGHRRHRPPRGRRGLGRGGGHRLRDRHSAGAHRTDLRAAGPRHHRGRRDRPGPVHRPGHRRGARRHAHGTAGRVRGLLPGLAPG